MIDQNFDVFIFVCLQNILLAPAAAGSSKQKPIAPKSPAKILPAPVPSGDQQQSGSGAPKFMIKQGNVLTPLNQSQEKYLAIPTANGGVSYMLDCWQNSKSACILTCVSPLFRRSSTFVLFKEINQ